MKRRTAILLSGTLVLGVAGYVAGCLRSFYLRPGLEFDASVSPDGRGAAEAWVGTSGYPTCDPFEWSGAFEYLCHPWHAMRGTPVVVREEPGTGLWATYRHRIWSLTKPDGRDVGVEGMGAVRDLGFIPVEQLRLMRRYEVLASEMEALIAGEGTIEILSLDPETGATHRDRPRRAPQPADGFPGSFHQYRILGRAMVEEPEDRQHLLGELAHSIRDAAVDIDWMCFIPRHGIIHTRGDQWTEYLICFECGPVEVFESSGEKSGFKVAARGGDVFAAYLDKLGIEQDRPGH